MLLAKRFFQLHSISAAAFRLRGMCENFGMVKTGSTSMPDKYDGCLLGALVGDCLGAVFEAKYWRGVPEEVVKAKLDPRGKSMLNKADGSMKYTDDTAMARSICSSLLECDRFDAVHLARAFSQSFSADPNRGYGSGAYQLLSSWRNEPPTEADVLDRARQMFDGLGSHGNGGAMRVAPVALFARSEDEVVDLAVGSARLTHSHQHGYLGAVLQALAVYQALTATEAIDPALYLNSLKMRIMALEERDEALLGRTEPNVIKVSTSGRRDNANVSYSQKLERVKSLLVDSSSAADDDVRKVVEELGNGIPAIEAVPAAIYAFLRTLTLGFEDCLYYAIRLGGDTDTIASMACAIAGAYYGKAAIPEKWLGVSEASPETLVYSQRLYVKRWSPKTVM